MTYADWYFLGSLGVLALIILLPRMVLLLGRDRSSEFEDDPPCDLRLR